MSSDLLILQALRDRMRWRSLHTAVPTGVLSADAQCVLGWLPHYWQAFPEHERVDLDALDGLIKLRGNYQPEQLAVVRHLLHQMSLPVDDVALRGVTNQLYERDFAGKSAALISRYQNGEEVDLTFELGRMAEQTKKVLTVGDADRWGDDPIEDLLALEDVNHGLRFPTTLLREHIAGLTGGASVVLAARPDKGKGSFLAATAVEWAKQLEDYFDPERPILWLSNEGSYRRIVPRIYSAALRCTGQELQEKSNAGTLRDEYIEAVGRLDRIRVKDVHGLSIPQCERFIETMKPCVVFFDMVANFRSTAAAGGNKTDAEEQKFQIIRELAVNHDFVSIGTVQISVEGANMLYPPYSALKDSKTGIQGACDTIIMQGSLDSAEMAALRGFSTPKNKFSITGKPSYCQGEVVFDAERCYYYDGGAL